MFFILCYLQIGFDIVLVPQDSALQLPDHVAVGADLAEIVLDNVHSKFSNYRLFCRISRQTVVDTPFLYHTVLIYMKFLSLKLAGFVVGISCEVRVLYHLDRYDKSAIIDFE